MLLEGIFLPLTTPFLPNERVNLHKVAANVHRYSLTPAAGMLVAGRTGESDSLSSDELIQVFETAIAAASPQKVMLAAARGRSVHETLQLAQAAATLGYDALAVAPPAYTLLTGFEHQLRVFFEVVADRAPLPLILLSEEAGLPLDLIAALAQHANVLGIIDDQAQPERLRTLLEQTAGASREVTVTTTFSAATGRMLRASGAAVVSASELGAGGSALTAGSGPGLKTRTKRIGFQLLAGRASTMLAAWQAGASGALPTLAAAAPQACCEVWQAFRDGDAALAEEKQERIREAAEQTEGVGGLAAVKYGCDRNGYFGGRPRLPVLPPALSEREKVDRLLGNLRN